MFHINAKSREPIYEQLEKLIIKYISLKIILPGEQLPSVRSMAQELGVNPNTVQKAYSSLEDSGFVFTVVGKGVFVCNNDKKVSAIQEVSLQRLKEMSRAAMNAGVMLDKQLEAIRRVFEEEKND